MTPQTLGELTIRQVPLLRAGDEVGDAVRRIIEAAVPALPVVESGGKLKGIFGEREFLSAIFPGYLGELHYAGFVTKTADELIDRRAECALDPVSKYMNTEHIEVAADYSDAQLAETFLHHRVLIIPIVDRDEVRGIVTRGDFFRALAERLAARS